MLDTLSNRIDYLEKICQKVETASKKHAQKRPALSLNNKSPSPDKSADTKTAATAPPENREAAANDKEMDLKKQMAADDSACLLYTSPSPRDS